MESFIIAGIAPFFVENIPELQLAALKLVTGMYIPTDYTLYTVQPGQDLVLLELWFYYTEKIILAWLRLPGVGRHGWKMDWLSRIRKIKIEKI